MIEATWAEFVGVIGGKVGEETIVSHKNTRLGLRDLTRSKPTVTHHECATMLTAKSTARKQHVTGEFQRYEKPHFHSTALIYCYIT